MRRPRRLCLTLLAVLALGLGFVADSAFAQSKYKESPALAEAVKAGKLPPVDQRLPSDPLVVPVVERVGTYGGVWRRAFLGPADANNYVRVVYDALVRHSPDGGKIEPKIAAGWESSKDFKQWTIKLRPGAKWSDGAPFTADDIVFWYQDVLLNKDLVPAVPSWMKNADGSTAVVEKVSPTAARFTFKQANTLVLTALANADGGDRTYAAFLPAHYLKKFHATYVKKEDLDKLVAGSGFKTWTELFAARNAPPENPERPTMAAWVPASRVSDQVFTLKRNPYFVGVDPSGNQLPYLDEVRFTFFADIQALNLAAIAGDFDMQERHIQMTNYPVFKENEKSGKYRVITWATFGGSDAVVQLNQTYKADPDIGKLMATKEFRVALSHAVNRDQIKESVFLGLGEARQGVPPPGHPYYPGDQVAHKYTEYKPEESNKLLDGLGLSKRDGDGTRLMANGKRVVLELSVVPGLRRLARRGPAHRQGLGEGRRQDRSADPRARPALPHARQQRADDRDVERGHHRLPLHRQRQVRSAQLAHPHPGAALRPLGRDQGQGGRGAAGLREADHGDRGPGQDGERRAAGQACAGAVPHLGG